MSGLTPNRHGVWPKDTAEHLVLSRRRKTHAGMPLAEIAVLETPHGWLASAGYDIAGKGGGGYGLSETHCGGYHPTRRAALDHAIAGLRRSIASGYYSTDPEARAIEQWLARIFDQPPERLVQQDFFA